LLGHWKDGASRDTKSRKRGKKPPKEISTLQVWEKYEIQNGKKNKLRRDFDSSCSGRRGPKARRKVAGSEKHYTKNIINSLVKIDSTLRKDGITRSRGGVGKTGNKGIRKRLLPINGLGYLQKNLGTVLLEPTPKKGLGCEQRPIGGQSLNSSDQKKQNNYIITKKKTN